MTKLDYCVICKSTQNKIIYPGIVKCKNCSHIFADLELSDKEYNSLYDHTYFHGKNILIISRIKKYYKTILI